METGVEGAADEDDEEDGDATETSPENRVFNRLCVDGWILETTTRRAPEIYMPREAQFLLSALVNIQEELKVDIPGQASAIDSTIRAAYDDPVANVLNIATARRHAVQLRRAIDGVIASLYRIEQDLLSAPGLAELLARFMESFVEKLLLENYRALKSTAYNPMRFQRSIMTTIDLFINDDGLVASAAIAIADFRPDLSPQAAAIAIRKDLSAIRDVFMNLGDKLDEIERFSYKLERRIATTVSYQESSRNLRDETIKAAIARGFAELDQGEGDCISPLSNLPVPYSTATLAQPQKAREPVAPEVRERRGVDPIDMLRARMLDTYNASMTVTRKALRERLVEVVGEEFMDIDDFEPRDARDIAILFELRNGLAADLPGFETKTASGTSAGKYISGQRLFIRRNGAKI